MSPPSRWRRWRRRILWLLAGMAGLLTVLLAIGLLLAWQAFGKKPEGARLERMQRSTLWDGDGFENPRPLWNDTWGAITAIFSGSDHATPSGPLPVVKVDPTLFETPPASGLRVTWLGHSTLLIEIDGARFLTDPVWGPRTSPLTFLGPKRWYAPPIALAELPSIDAVVISHDHYDHLDYPTLRAMRDWNTRFIVPLGVGAHLEYWGVPRERIIELEWWERTTVRGIEIVCSPARHASGRHILDQNRTLWAGYAFLGATHRAYFSGDTGMFPELADIGAKLGPFDVTMVEVGAYHRAWPDWHIGPEQAIAAHQLLRGKAFIPVHWGLFDLAMHGWTEPIERTVVAAEAAGVRALTPRPGQSLEPATARTERWWPLVPWQTATEHPIKSTGL